MPQPFAAISASERVSGIGLEPNLIRFDPIPVPSRSCARLERHREVAQEKAEWRSIERPRRARRLFSVEEGLMADEDVKAELERPRKESAALKQGASSNVRMKVSEKGALSVYGMGRFPVTLYKEQWLRLLDMADDIRAFIAANDSALKVKD